MPISRAPSNPRPRRCPAVFLTIQPISCAAFGQPLHLLTVKMNCYGRTSQQVFDQVSHMIGYARVSTQEQTLALQQDATPGPKEKTQ
jgi:hypothetical protein